MCLSPLIAEAGGLYFAYLLEKTPPDASNRSVRTNAAAPTLGLVVFSEQRWNSCVPMIPTRPTPSPRMEKLGNIPSFACRSVANRRVGFSSIGRLDLLTSGSSRAGRSRHTAIRYADPVVDH